MVLNFSHKNQPLMKESNHFWRCQHFGRCFTRWKLQRCPCSPKYYALKVLCISLGTEISFGRLSDQYIRPAKDLAAKIRGNVLYLCHNDQPRTLSQYAYDIQSYNTLYTNNQRQFMTQREVAWQRKLDGIQFLLRYCHT